MELILTIALAMGVFTAGAKTGQHIEVKKQEAREEARAKAERRHTFILKNQALSERKKALRQKRAIQKEVKSKPEGSTP